MRITNPPPGHDSLDGVSTSDHHTKYSDADAVSAVVEDAAYGAGWNADTSHAPSQNAVYDAIEALHAAPSDTAYATSWNGVTAIAPSKNAVYDKIEALHAAPSDTAYANTWNGVTAIAPSKNAVYDKMETMGTASMATGSYTGDGATSLGITGVGFAVKVVWIIVRNTSDGFGLDTKSWAWSSDVMVDDNAAGMAMTSVYGSNPILMETNVIISLDADGFTVDDDGANHHVNQSGQVYNWWALG